MWKTYIPFRWHECLLVALIAGVLSYFMPTHKLCNCAAGDQIVASASTARLIAIDTRSMAP